MRSKLLEIDFLNRCWSLPCANVCVFHLFKKMLKSRTENLNIMMNRYKEQKGLNNKEKLDFVKVTLDSLKVIRKFTKKIKTIRGFSQSDWTDYLMTLINEYELVVDNFNRKLTDHYDYKEVDYETPKTLITQFNEDPRDWSDHKELASGMITVYIYYLDILDSVLEEPEFDGRWSRDTIKSIFEELNDLSHEISTMPSPTNSTSDSLETQSCYLLLKRLEFLINMVFKSLEQRR